MRSKGLKEMLLQYIHMDMNVVTPPKRGLKTRHYNKDMDMEDHIVTLPKRGLKTRPYSMDMNKDIATLPKKGLKTRPYNIDIEKKGLKKYDYNVYMDTEKKDLKKLTKGQLINQTAIEAKEIKEG